MVHKPEPEPEVEDDEEEENDAERGYDFEPLDTSHFRHKPRETEADADADDAPPPSRRTKKTDVDKLFPAQDYDKRTQLESKTNNFEFFSRNFGDIFADFEFSGLCFSQCLHPSSKSQ